MYPGKLLKCDTTEYLPLKVEMEGVFFFLSSLTKYRELTRAEQLLKGS